MNEGQMQVILESIDSKLDLVFEGFTALDRKIDQVHDDLSGKIDQCNFRIDVLNDKIDAVEARLNDKIDVVEARLSSRIDAVAADLTAHRADTEGHRGAYRVSE